MNYTEFLKIVNTMSPDGKFSFGTNWCDYVQNRVTDQIVLRHKDNLHSLYQDINLKNKSVLDIGCGSGISSLSFGILGAKKILSIDVDKQSVNATKILQNKFKHLILNECEWDVQHNSILNGEYLNSLNKFDVVYSWGVLHHTGDMWKAIENTIKLVNNGGILHLALYVAGDRYKSDLDLKMRFNKSSDEDKIQLIYNRLHRRFGDSMTDRIFTVDERGMNKYNDAIDWLGGLPYEVCDPNVLDVFMQKNNFHRKYYRPGMEGGNFVSIYVNNN